MTEKNAPESRPTFSTVEVIFTFVLLGLFVWSLVPDTGYRPISDRSHCKNDLYQIGIALEMYHVHWGAYPPAYVTDSDGTPLYSWRVLILPFNDLGHLYEKWDLAKSWNSPENRELSSLRLGPLRCPAAAETEPANHTHYLAVVGPETAWNGAVPRRADEFADPEEIVFVVEVEKGVPWAAPIDINASEISLDPENKKGIASQHDHGGHALFADGAVHYLRDAADMKKHGARLTVNRSKPGPD